LKAMRLKMSDNLIYKILHGKTTKQKKVAKASVSKGTTNAYRAAATGEKLISSLDQALAIIATYNAFVAACGGKDQADKAFVALTQEGLTA
jgi:hypothetical protein